ncbi:hypothetical protein EC844_103195 [Acinetobacter calcoaceticus]|uniref:Uncharacterized protein n=1 Tax=Acinetobacter calcoaceticus TaxID=471 RepID=A0A4V2R1N9_ACICA|nr:hypothetical protein EC844_103195 [Acinetobacter calcoaceticus]
MPRTIKLTNKRFLILTVLVLIALFTLPKLIRYWTDAMKPAVVFLMPEDFIGPVFVVFSQEDGQDLKPDPLGVSLSVPENGLLKVKASQKDVLTKGMNYQKRNVYWISLNKDGQRSNLPYQGGGGRDYEKKINWVWYINSDNQAKQMIFDEKLYPKSNDPEFYFLSNGQVKSKTVYFWDSCDAYIWKNKHELELYRRDKNIDKERHGEAKSCMQFSISYPKMEDEELNNEVFLGDYSLPEFEQKLDEIKPLRQQYLKEYLEQQKD